MSNEHRLKEIRSAAATTTRKIEYIVIHTAAAGDQNRNIDITMASMRNYHVNHLGWSDVGYHYGIRFNGDIEDGRPLQRTGAHTRCINHNSIGIVCSGHGDYHRLTESQYDTLVKLVAMLASYFDIPIDNIIGHREIDDMAARGVVRRSCKTGKTCPGSLVDMDDIRENVKHAQHGTPIQTATAAPIYWLDGGLIEKGEEGEHVRQLQKILNLVTSADLIVDGDFGPKTKEAVQSFQNTVGLDPDGVVGPLTKAAIQDVYSAATNDEVVLHGNSLGDTVLKYAFQEWPVAYETGRNSGPYVKKYMGQEGLPWCVGFATWCYLQACKELNIEPMIQERWSTSRLTREAKLDGLYWEPGMNGELKPGNMFCIKGNRYGTGWVHTGLVVKPIYEHGDLVSIDTIEGNISDKISRRRLKNINSMGFVVY